MWRARATTLRLAAKGSRRQQLVVPFASPSLNIYALYTASSGGNHNPRPSKGKHEDPRSTSNRMDHPKTPLSTFRRHPATIRKPPTLFSSNPENSAEVLRANTESLLEAPVASWTPAQWRDCVKHIHLWTATKKGTQFRQGRREQNAAEANRVAGTAESVVSSFALFERLLVEYRRSNNELLARELIQTGLLNLVIKNWAICWQRLHPKSKIVSPHVGDAEIQAKILLTYTPDSILGRLDGYQCRSKDLLAPDKLVYLTIVAAAAASRTPNIILNVLDRMVGNNMQKEDDANSPRTNHATLDRDMYVACIKTCAKMSDAAQAEAVLENMYTRFVESGSEDLQPTTIEFNLVLLAWSLFHDDLKYASDRSQAIFRRMDMLSAPGGALEGKASADAFSAALVMKCLSRWLEGELSDNMVNAQDYIFVGQTAEDLMHEMEERYHKGGEGNGKKLLSSAMYNSLLRIMSQLGNAERAEALLTHMYDEFHIKNNQSAKPQAQSFNKVIAAWRNYQKVVWSGNGVWSSKCTKIPQAAVAERAEAIFRRLQKVHRSGSLKDVKPTRESWLGVLTCWAETRSMEAGDRALAILNEAMEAEKETGEKFVSSGFYGACIHAQANAGNALAAERLLAEFRRQYHEEGNHAAKPTMNNLSMVMNAWAKSNDPGAAERADKLLQGMRSLYDEGILELPPDRMAYSSVIECYAKSSLPGAIDRAEALLKEMEQRSLHGEAHLRPNVVAYRHVMNCYARRGMVKEAEGVLERMFDEHKRGNLAAKPSVKAVNLVFVALSNSNVNDAGARAISFVRRMEKLYEQQKFDGKPDVVTFTLALKCVSNSDSKYGGEEAEALLDEMEMRAAQGETSLAPNTMSYSTVIQIYGRSGKPEKAEAVLERMYRAYKDGNLAAAPNVRTFTSILQAWARAADDNSFKRSLAILEWMKELHAKKILNDVKPNLFIYGAVLGSMANSTNKEVCQRAIDLLDEMEELADRGDPDMAPNHICYNNALRVIANNAGGGIKAQELIARMYQKYESGNPTCKPNILSWRTVLEAWCKSKDPTAPVRVQAILKRIKELHEAGVLEEGPDARSYLCALVAFASQRKTRKHIPSILDELEKLAHSGDQSLTMFDHLLIIRALCRLNDVDMFISAEMIQQRMLKQCDRSSSRWNPNVVKASYHALIEAWSKSRDKHSSDHAKRLRRELESQQMPVGW